MNDDNLSLKRRRFSLVEIYHEIIAEAFDFKNIKTFKFKPNSEGFEFDAKFLDGSVKTIYVYFEKTRIGRFETSQKFLNATDVINFGFEIGPSRDNSQISKNDYQTYIRIIATVGRILQSVINIKSPEIITLFSDSKHGGKAADPQKDNIYFTALDKNPISGYELADIFDKVDKKKGMMLYRKNAFK